MGGERHEVHAERTHVHRAVRDALRGVEERERARGVGLADDLRDGVDGSEDVGDVHERHQLRAAVGQEPGEGRELQLAVRGHRDEPQLQRALGGQHLPRHQIRVVLHLREHDRIAGLEIGAGPRPGDQVDGLGAVARVDDLVRRAADESGDPPAGVLEGRRGLLGDPVGPAVDVGVVARVVAVHRVEHGVGLLGGRRAVQIDERPVLGLPEHREVPAQGARVEDARRGRRDRPGGGGMGHSSYPIFCWIASRSWPRTLSRGIRSITGAKKPSTMSRCASLERRPRVIR